MRRTLAAAGMWAAVCLAAPGCHVGAGASRSGASAATARPLVELFSWWTAPGEAEALEALIAEHEKAHPGARIFNAAAASGAQARRTLNLRLEQSDPPDLFQEYVHDLREKLKQGDSARVPLDDMFEALRLRDAVFPDVIREVTSDGHIMAMPVNIHRENALFYNKRLFAAHHLTPPRTLPELLRACQTLKAAGVIPVATAGQGWILRIMFNSLAAGSMGAAAYRDYFTGVTAADVPRLRAAIAVFAEVLQSYANPDATEEGFNWTTAAQAVYNGDAAMFLHGDWAKGYFVQLGWQPDVDFGMVGAPGADELFLYGIDAFALPAGARNVAGARDLLATIASPRGQVTFNRLKGSSPIRRDVAREGLDPMGRQTLAALENAQIRMLVHSRPVWEDALLAFAHDHDREKLLKAFLDAPPAR